MPHQSEESVAAKMSSDSAFQSLGDGLELEEEKNSPALTKSSKFEPNKLEMQMKAIAEEAKNVKLKGESKFKGNMLALIILLILRIYKTFIDIKTLRFLNI